MIRRLALSLALFAGLAIPAACRAEYVIFRNECKAAIVVQTASVVRGVLKRDQALLKPGEYTGKISLDSDKIITFCDGRTGTVLFRDPLRATTKPLAFAILPAPKGKVRVEKRMLPGDKPE